MSRAAKVFSSRDLAMAGGIRHAIQPAAMEGQTEHPIYALVFELATKGTGSGAEPLVLDDVALEKIWDALSAHLEGPELHAAVEAILSAGQTLHTRFRSPKAVKAVLNLIDNETVILAMQSMTHRLRTETNGKQAETRSTACASLVGQSRATTAPKHGEKAPEGTIRVSSLANNTRGPARRVIHAR